MTIPAGNYSFNRMNIQLRSADQRAFGGGMFINDGEFYDGERFGVTTFFGWRSPHFRANLNYQYNEMAFPGKGDDLLANGQPRVHDAGLSLHHARRAAAARDDLLVAAVVDQLDPIRQRQRARSA